MAYAPGFEFDVFLSYAHKNLTRDEWAVFVGDEIPYVKTCPDRP